jgi:DNA-binding transcriptional LysR family regulator
LTERLQEGRAALKGRLRLVVPAGLGQTVLVGIAGRFRREHPLVEIEWHLDDTADLAAADADLWIRVGPIHDETLIVRRFGSIERWLVAAPGQGEVSAPRDLAGRAAILLRNYVGAELPLGDARGNRIVLSPRGAFLTDSLFAAAAAVREGIGYATLPRWLVAEDVAAGRLLHLCPSWRPADLDLSVAYPPTRHRPARVAAFLEMLRRELPRAAQGIIVAA